MENRRVLLLYGPPGTGKSTMARVLAAQSGFNAKSINASDVRTGAELVSIIKDALEMNFIDQQDKPTCLVLDEIDGALGGAEGD